MKTLKKIAFWLGCFPILLVIAITVLTLFIIPLLGMLIEYFSA